MNNEVLLFILLDVAYHSYRVPLNFMAFIVATAILNRRLHYLQSRSHLHSHHRHRHRHHILRHFLQKNHYLL